MRNRHLKLTALFIALSLLAAGCAIGAGTQDWTYYGLPGDYSLWRTNTRCITIGFGREKDSAKVVVDKYVSELWLNDEYILAKQVEVPQDLNENISFDTPAYFIITVSDGSVLGPLGENDFESRCAEFGIEKIEWMNTNSYAQKAE